MSNDKYVGLDVHQSSIVTAVHNHQGKCVMESIIETKAQPIRDFIKSVSGTVHVVFEEGAQATWLYDLIHPLVAEVVVCNPKVNNSPGNTCGAAVELLASTHPTFRILYFFILLLRFLFLYWIRIWIYDN